MKKIIVKMTKEEASFDEVASLAKAQFITKYKQYGDSWRTMDVQYIADRMMVKCHRISQLLSGKQAQVNEGIEAELMDITNYGIIALMHIKAYEQGLSKNLDDKMVEILYDACVAEVRVTLKKKNHDYNDAWKTMPYSSIITQMKMGLSRILNGDPVMMLNMPEDAIDQLQDIVNYCLIGARTSFFSFFPARGLTAGR